VASRILVVFGTRPEAIKVAPVVDAIRRHPGMEVAVAVTAQHREMLDQVLELFEIVPDFDLDIMEPGQSLTDITVRVLAGLGPVIKDVKPDAVLVQGDTTTTFAGALAGLYARLPVIHVEAGYRTNDKLQPFPEEINRRLVSELADLHFAANAECERNLLTEGHSPDAIHVVGNTGIDALKRVAAMRLELADDRVREVVSGDRRVVLMTMHRRENWGAPIEEACRAAKDIAAAHADVDILFATHLNPVVQDAARAVLEDVERVHVLPALDYATFTHVLARADLVMSDSGGVHEEALALGKPLLLLRNVSEWPDALASGAVRLVGTDRGRIVSAATEVIAALDSGVEMPVFSNPLADGRASERVVAVLRGFLGSRE